MNKIRIWTRVIVLASAFGFASAAMADPPTGGFNSQFAITAPIIDFIDGSGSATCTDREGDGQCEGSVAFITKTGFWGVHIEGVELANPLDTLRVCLTGETSAFGPFAVKLVSGLVPEGPKNTVSAGGDVFTDTGFVKVGLPGFGILSCPGGNCDDVWECGGGTNILEFETGIRVD